MAKPEFQVGDIIVEIGGDARKWVVTYATNAIYWLHDLRRRNPKIPSEMLSRERGDRDFVKVGRARFGKKGEDGQ